MAHGGPPDVQGELIEEERQQVAVNPLHELTAALHMVFMLVADVHVTVEPYEEPPGDWLFVQSLDEEPTFSTRTPDMVHVEPDMATGGCAWRNTGARRAARRRGCTCNREPNVWD